MKLPADKNPHLKRLASTANTCHPPPPYIYISLSLLLSLLSLAVCVGTLHMRCPFWGGEA